MLSKTTNTIKADDLIGQIERVVIEKFFSKESKVSLDFICLNAYEFSKVQYEFTGFY